MLSAVPVYSQRMVSSDQEVDSLVAATARQQLNSLPDTDYARAIFQAQGKSLPYRLLKPARRQEGKSYPLIITLHNSSRIGQDNEKQLEPLARIWLRPEIRERYPAFVIAPQFAERSSNYVQDVERKVFKAIPSADVGLLVPLIKSLLKQHPDIDRSRIYIVGYSMGASTGQNLMSLKPGLFAALVSIAAVPDFSNLPGLAGKPVWLIHGKQDDENPYPGSVALYQALKQNRQLLFTTYTHLNHNNIMIPFLLDEAIPEWLFRQQKK